MKRIFFLLLFYLFLVGATIDTFEGHSVDTSHTIEGTDVADTMEGQTIKSAYSCSGDWGAGGVIESFENSSGDGNFCTSDWTVEDDDGVINTYDATQAHHLTHSLSIIHDAETVSANTVVGALNSAGSRWFGFWYYCPSPVSILDFVAMPANSSHQEVVRVTLDNDSGTYKMCFASDCTTDYFSLTPSNWYYIAIYAENAGTCQLKVYNASKVQQDCVGTGECSTNVMEKTGQSRDVEELYIEDHGGSTTATTSYYDEIQNSATELTP